MDLRPSRAGAAVPSGLLHAATAVACLMVLAVGAYLVTWVLGMIMPVTMAIVAALLLAALIGPGTERLKRTGVPPALSALVGVVGLLVVVGGAVYLVGQRAVAQFGSLRREVGAGVVRLRQLLTHGPLSLSQEQLHQYTAELFNALRRGLPSPFTGAATAVEVVGGLVLALFLLFFALRDGPQMWCWLVDRLPPGGRDRVDRAGRAGWHSLSSYMRGIVLIAAVDAAGIGAALFALGVPLALSLMLLTFLAAFVPIVGAVVAGAAATLVTFVTNGTTDALLVVAAVIGVHEAEGNLLHPTVMRRAVRLHPVVTLLAVGAGSLFAGVAGALIAVPLCAFAFHATRGYAAGPGAGVGAGGEEADRAEKDLRTGSGRHAGRADGATGPVPRPRAGPLEPTPDGTRAAEARRRAQDPTDDSRTAD